MSAQGRHRINVHDLASELADAVDLLERLTANYTRAVTDAALAEAAYKRAYHIARVEHANREGTTDKERESLTMKQCADLHTAHVEADAALSAVREQLRTGHARVDAIRTLTATSRQLMQGGDRP